MKIDINWLEPWTPFYSVPMRFEKELQNELNSDHILYGKKVKAIGKRIDCDNFLFQVHDPGFGFAVVHLTFSIGKEKCPNWPRTTVYKDIDDWINNCMIPDHSAYMI